MCSFKPRSLISLLNAAKEQPAALAIAAEFLTFGPRLSRGTAKKLADPGCSPAANYNRSNPIGRTFAQSNTYRTIAAFFG
jgi:hypothetical protein